MRNSCVHTKRFSVWLILLALLASALLTSCSGRSTPNNTATFTPGGSPPSHVDTRPAADPAKDSRPGADVAGKAPSAPDTPESRPGAGPAANVTEPKMLASAGKTDKAKAQVSAEGVAMGTKATGGPAAGGPVAAGRQAGPMASGPAGAGPADASRVTAETAEGPAILNAYASIPASGKEKIKDIEPGNSVKVSLYNDGSHNGPDRWDRMKVDYNRNDKWDEKWSDMDGDGVFDRRQISTKDDESYDRELLLKNGRWVPKE